MIDRRKFLEISGAGLAVFSLVSNENLFAQETRENDSSRRVFPLNRNWLYGGKTVPNAYAANFDDRKFERVTIPHTNKMLPWHGFDDKEYQFVSIYRRHFKLPENLRGNRVFVDFAGVMTAAKVYLNGENIGEYLGGYTPFSFELTDKIDWKNKNVLAVEVDSTERADIPPFGGLIDYLTFGGIYREVSLRVVPKAFIENIFVKPVNVLQPDRSVRVEVFYDGNIPLLAGKTIEIELRDGEKIVAQTKNFAQFPDDGLRRNAAFHLTNLGAIELWDVNNPKLYTVRVKLLDGEKLTDEMQTRIGFREAKFTPKGFYLNGKHLKLRGLNRHQTYPYVGQAMPERVQKRDAWILKKELKCNIVRTSHYPQSKHFLDVCDELGLLVFEEIPGWQHVGDEAWKELSVKYVEAMIRRDWNHPSIILWGVRVNESGDYHDFYAKTNALAHSLDDSRQTGGVRYKYDSERLEDVFTMNDFYFPLKEPNHPLYLNTEFSGHMFPTKRTDNVERQTEHAIRHARIHNQIASSEKYAGGLGWCAFDYNTHSSFGSGDHICYHGVSDIFRIPKLAAGFYKSQCDPSEEIVLEPIFHWSEGDRAETGGLRNAMIASNCEKLKIYINDKLETEVAPNSKDFGNLKYPPFFADIKFPYDLQKNDLKIEGYIGGKLIVTKMMSGKAFDQQFLFEADDNELNGDGIDATRVVLKVTDEFGNLRPFASGAVLISIEGAGEIIGENPFALVGGTGAVWIKTKETRKAGVIRVSAKHPILSAKSIEIKVNASPAEEV